MLGLEFVVPTPLVLFISVLALVAIGFTRTADTQFRMLWMALGFSEIMLAFICFVALPTIFYLTPVVDYVTPIAFSFISLFLAFGAGLLILKGKK